MTFSIILKILTPQCLDIVYLERTRPLVTVKPTHFHFKIAKLTSAWFNGLFSIVVIVRLRYVVCLAVHSFFSLFFMLTYGVCLFMLVTCCCFLLICRLLLSCNTIQCIVVETHPLCGTANQWQWLDHWAATTTTTFRWSFLSGQFAQHEQIQCRWKPDVHGRTYNK